MEYPLRLYKDPEEGSYFSLLPKDIWRYCILPYLDGEYWPDSWGQQFVDPVWICTMALGPKRPSYPRCVMDKFGRILYEDSSTDSRICCLDPRDGQIQTIYENSLTLRISGYNPDLHALQCTTTYPPERYHFFLSSGVLELFQPGQSIRILGFQDVVTLGKTSLELLSDEEKGDRLSYEFLYDWKPFRAGPLPHQPLNMDAMAMFYYGGYLIVIDTQNQAHFYQIIR